MPTVRMHVGDVRDIMTQMIERGDTFDLLVTSPPFLALRSYLPADHPDKHREIGSEPTPATFLDTLYGLTSRWGRLLPEWASICVELGDTMSGSGGAGGDYNENGLREGQERFRQARGPDLRRSGDSWWTDGGGGDVRVTGGPGWPLSKSMCILPHAYTLGLAYGINPLTGTPTPAGQWRIRNVITWARPNPPVGSLGKRNPHKRTGDYKFRPACSFITVACRGTGRYFDLDAVRTQHKTDPATYTGNGYSKGNPEGIPGNEHMPGNPAGAPPLDWHTDDLDGDWLWRLPTAPYKGSHYATYPLTLPRRMVLAMCPESVCDVCGWPRERVTETVSLVNGKPRDASINLTGRSATEPWRNDDAPRIATGATFGSTSTTLGFTDCDCLCYSCGNGGCPECTHKYRPGHVLDPFGGSGTTAVAAALENRDCTLIDLDPRNVELVRKRLGENFRIVSERLVEEPGGGQSFRWVVENVTATELEADRRGQMGLFA